MKYRVLGKTGEMVSALGFGMMRLPVLKDGTIDEKATVDMVRYAIDNGVNYIDTAYGYHEGNSETVTGKALKDGYREKVFLVTKAPWWEYKSADDFDRILDIQLKKLQTDHLDLYLLHALNNQVWENIIIPFNIVEKIKKAKQEGKIKNFGFSFHDNIEVFKKIIDFTDWDVCQIQLNYLDILYQAGVEGLKYANSKGIGVVIMEPLRGGKLVKVPEKVKEIFEKSDVKRSSVEWAFDFLWDKKEVGLLLSGMGSIEQVKANIEYASRSEINMLSEDEKEIIKKAQKQFLSYDVIPCTGCSYCVPCPKGVAIPDNFQFYNEYKTYGNLEEYRKNYKVWLSKSSAEQCIECGKCEKICPQHLHIRDELKKVLKTFNN